MHAHIRICTYTGMREPSLVFIRSRSGSNHIYGRDILSWYSIGDQWWWGVSPEKYNAHLIGAACFLGNWWEVHCSSFQWEAGQEWKCLLSFWSLNQGLLFCLWVWQDMGRAGLPFVSWFSLRVKVSRTLLCGMSWSFLGWRYKSGDVEWMAYERKKEECWAHNRGYNAFWSPHLSVSLLSFVWWKVTKLEEMTTSLNFILNSSG